LPNFEWLLRFADEPRRVRDWRAWLAAELRLDAFERLPVAQACELQFLGHAGTGWLATPVHLEARLDHVRLVDRGLLRMSPAQRAECCRGFAAAFGSQYALHDVGERAFLLTGISPVSAPTRDPARLLDSDIGAALPRGPEATELRRLGAEIEMWLHRAQFNEARDDAHELRISALWIWGGGPKPAPVAAPGSTTRGRATVHFYGGDPFLFALAQSIGGKTAALTRLDAAPAAYAEMSASLDDHAVVELTPMTGVARESLESLDANWFAAVRAALDSGTLSSCDLVVNDRCFRVGSRAGWKFWRRHQSWLQRLRSEGRGAKA
jgi:hypothetical protein